MPNNCLWLFVAGQGLAGNAHLPLWIPAGTLSASSASTADSSTNATLRPMREPVLPQMGTPAAVFMSSCTCSQAVHMKQGCSIPQ